MKFVPGGKAQSRLRLEYLIADRSGHVCRCDPLKETRPSVSLVNLWNGRETDSLEPPDISVGNKGRGNPIAGALSKGHADGKI